MLRICLYSVSCPQSIDRRFCTAFKIRCTPAAQSLTRAFNRDSNAKAVFNSDNAWLQGEPAAFASTATPPPACSILPSWASKAASASFCCQPHRARHPEDKSALGSPAQRAQPMSSSALRPARSSPPAAPGTCSFLRVSSLSRIFWTKSPFLLSSMILSTCFSASRQASKSFTLSCLLVGLTALLALARASSSLGPSSRGLFAAGSLASVRLDAVPTAAATPPVAVAFGPELVAEEALSSFNFWASLPQLYL
mmetsp:Transcript_23005/g.41840  ORF Transcript_23005/g.41840 Transcript_23005/m.41840 type:complete len:252 (+) Transcript_23005:334-1089(+)